MTVPRIPRIPRIPVALAALVLSVGALAACATSGTGTATTGTATVPASVPSDPTDGPLIEPVTVDVADLLGTTVELEVGQVLNINTGDLAEDSYSGEIEDPSVAEFTPGREDGGATFNPGVTGLAEGSTQVTLSNSDRGIEDVVFTVSVGAVTG